MTKLLRISVLVVLLFILAFGLIAAVRAPALMAATLGQGAHPNIGWNTKDSADAFSVAFVVPGMKPMIGWNT